MFFEKYKLGETGKTLLKELTFVAGEVNKQTLKLRYTPIANGPLKLRHCFQSLGRCFHTRKLEQRARYDIGGDYLGEPFEVFAIHSSFHFIY